MRRYLPLLLVVCLLLVSFFLSEHGLFSNDRRFFTGFNYHPYLRLCSYVQD